MVEAIREYLGELESECKRGNATEHSYRPALKRLLESSGKTIHAVNEPSRVECGAPDFEVSRGQLKIGYIEAKDVGKSLDEAEKSEQLKRYFKSLENLILTDYLEFRWYVNGEIRGEPVRLGQAAGGKILHEADEAENMQANVSQAQPFQPYKTKASCSTVPALLPFFQKIQIPIPSS